MTKRTRITALTAGSLSMIFMVISLPTKAQDAQAGPTSAPSGELLTDAQPEDVHNHEDSIEISPEQLEYIRRATEAYDLKNYNPSAKAADWVLVLNAPSYKNLNVDPRFTSVALPIDVDVVGNTQKPTLEFLLMLDPHVLIVDPNNSDRLIFSPEVFQQKLQKHHDAIEFLWQRTDRTQESRKHVTKIYLKKISDYLDETHNFTPQRVETVFRLCKAIRQKAQDAGLAPASATQPAGP